MCGIAGIISSGGADKNGLESVKKMLQIQSHRGPDSSGVWSGTAKASSIVLGFRRLSILDLTDAANQPMLSDDGRYVLIYNGEIYNYLELREELAGSGANFRTHGDTEVVLQAMIRWGIDAFTRFNGMWALVLLDLTSGEVTFSRDRFGVKPLYTHLNDKRLFVSSEIKAILKVAGTKFLVNPQIANTFLSQNLLCTSQQTFFEGIEEFPAGSWATLSVNEIGKKSLIPRRFWSIDRDSASYTNENTLLDSVRTTFIDAVRLRLRSDVPIGVLLSGGTDSSAIAATLHYLDAGRDDLKLISAVGTEGNDEQPFIDIMAKSLKRKVDKVAVNYSASETLDLMSEVSWFNDEPIGSVSTVAHYMLMNRAKDLGVTVLLSGQGADEILCGYKKYLGFYVQELIHSGHWFEATRVMSTFLENGTVLPQVNYQEAKRYLPQWLRFPETDIRGPALLDFNSWTDVGLNGGKVINRQIADIEKLSVPALVHYEDRMSMAAGREIRLPFLDYRFVNLVAPLPVNLKLRAGWTKWIFRRAMEPLLPKEIIWRKDKQNFIVPQNAWFRRELRQEIERLLDGEWVTGTLGLIDRRKFRSRYEAYLKQPAWDGRVGFKDIFAPIALELWARRFQRYLST